MITFERADPGPEHARIVMDWRNDPHTLAMFFHHTPKTWERFEEEFAGEYFSYPDLPPLFALAGGERVAFLRFGPAAHPDNPGRRCCDISINVTPGQRGRGIGASVLEKVLPLIRGQGFDDVLAVIRVENQASRRAFEKAGFRRQDEDDHLVEDTGERCRVVRYLAALTPSSSPGSG
jgi:RimJ/RimL family protein N-acetyltransferase